ncbi:hypothetical protein GMDG_02769 [Pseudogymnoascus destructans 20631-21]|uniref:Uncharacterized protein n=1 Tax=Pseudogymnoascus destructans (strain ATCC MYA-4855 / 20631-21) TaxID=658429 RepID=L8G415_PSED2|nr:hypothetical protein GMDG_02769 [Pseudogymnoascus destructans 20631-21]
MVKHTIIPLLQVSSPEMPSFSRIIPMKPQLALHLHHQIRPLFHATGPLQRILLSSGSVLSHHTPTISHPFSHLNILSALPPPRSRHKQPSSIQPSGYPTFKELVATSFLPLQPPVVVCRRTDCAVDERTTCLLMSCDARASR